jgi:hypothetical protein
MGREIAHRSHDNGDGDYEHQAETNREIAPQPGELRLHLSQRHLGLKLYIGDPDPHFGPRPADVRLVEVAITLRRSRFYLL